MFSLQLASTVTPEVASTIGARSLFVASEAAEDLSDQIIIDLDFLKRPNMVVGWMTST